jgi:hypothetical protein
MLGNTVMQGMMVGNQLLETSFLPKGIYFASIIHQNMSVTTLKFIKE